MDNGGWLEIVAASGGSSAMLAARASDQNPEADATDADERDESASCGVDPPASRQASGVDGGQHPGQDDDRANGQPKHANYQAGGRPTPGG